MSVLSRLTAASYWLCLQVCVTNKTLVSIDQLLSSLVFFLFFFNMQFTLRFERLEAYQLTSLAWGERLKWIHGSLLDAMIFLFLLLIICCHHVVRKKTALVHLAFLQNGLLLNAKRRHLMTSALVLKVSYVIEDCWRACNHCLWVNTLRWCT